MRSRSARILVFLFCFVLVVAVPAIASARTDSPDPAPSVVVFESGSEGAANPAAVLARAGLRPGKVVSRLGMAVVDDPADVVSEALKDVDGVQVASAVRYSTDAKPVRNAQSVPWGVTRVGAPQVWPVTTGDPVRVAVIDTGVNPVHPDLVANVKSGYSAVDYTTAWGDDYGHGTHVAGTIAAADNLLGVIGVAPAVDLYSVKVLDYTGSGWDYDIAEGIDWAVANGINVINMSLGGGYSYSVDLACQRAVAAGVVVVASAGNSGPAMNTVGYPGALPQVIGVAATDSNNNVAYFSSRGPQVDIAAPGVSVNSTYWTPRKPSSYGTMSGTSMAAPHVSGAAALLLTAPVGASDADLDGAWDPAEVQARLQSTALDLGTPGLDSYYGYGLVQLPAAFAQ